jgi:hypothetical protein
VQLSRKLGTVEFFSANRYAQHHAWIKAYNGRIIRAYAWAGTTVWDQGTPTKQEKALRLNCFNYAEIPTGSAERLAAVFQTNIEKVPLLAARWGLDIECVRGHFLLDEHGVSGKADRRY